MAIDPYDPEAFRRHGHAIVDALADHLIHTGRREGPVLPATSSRANVAAWESNFSGGVDPVDLFARVVLGSNHLQHPGFVGHQVTAPLPVTALAELVGGLLNNGTAVYEMGPVSSAMERVVARFFARKIGWNDGADAIFTSGGSAGNLTALLAARARTAAQLGDPSFRGAVIACEEAHYSTARAVHVMGWGEGGLVKVPADAAFRLRPDRLDEAFEKAERAGRRVVAVVASACSTSTGAFDPLNAIADFCEARGVWMHVDGAHGASFVLSPKHRHLLDGIARADSVVWDAHKMMLCPALVTAVVFKGAQDSWAAFRGTQAAYLLEDPDAQTDGALRTLECTKRMLILGLYSALAVHGEEMIARYLDDVVDLSRAFAEKVRTTPGFELALAPECNIVCFRHGDDDARQDRIRSALLEDGSFYIVKTKLRGKTWLRTTILNPRTTMDDLDRLLARIARV